MKKFFFLLFAITLLSGCNGKPDTGTSATEKDVDAENPPLSVESIVLTKDRLISAVEASGIVSGGNEAYAVIEGRGIITAVNFRLGERVEKGDVLVTLDSSLASSGLDLARQQYRTAQLSYDALKKSYENGGTSLFDFNQGESRLISARVAFEQAEKALADCTLRAPISGYIAGKDSSVSLGNLASAGIRAAYIVDTSSYVMEVYLGEKDIVLVTPGNSARIILNDTGETVTANAAVRAVAAGSDKATGSYAVVIAWEKNDIPVKPGMSARAVIATEVMEPEILVPASAVLKRDNRFFVYLDRGGTAEPVIIEPGKRQGNIIAVKNGLEEGAVLILSGLSTLAPGMKVRSVPEENTL